MEEAWIIWEIKKVDWKDICFVYLSKGDGVQVVQTVDSFHDNYFD